MKNYFYLLFVLGLNLIYGQEYEADIFVNQKPTPPSSNQIGRKVFRVMCPSVRIHRDGTAWTGGFWRVGQATPSAWSDPQYLPFRRGNVCVNVSKQRFAGARRGSICVPYCAIRGGLDVELPKQKPICEGEGGGLRASRNASAQHRRYRFAVGRRSRDKLDGTCPMFCRQAGNATCQEYALYAQTLIIIHVAYTLITAVKSA